MRWTKVVALAAAGTLSLAACGGSPSSNKPNNAGKSGSSSSSEGPASAGLDPSAKGPAPDIQGAKKGGTLTVAYSSVPETFDPTESYYQDTGAILGQLVLRSLTTYKVENGKSVLVPDLATDLGKVSSDGLTWTFTLKDGLKYSDGSPIKAADFVYAVKRSFAQDELAGGPTYVNTYLKDGDTYKGPFKDKSKPFAGASAPDDKTVVFHLKQKWPTLPYYAAFSQVSPIPEGKDTKEKYGTNPLAQGPYMFDKYTKGQELKLKKNPNWDPKSDPARRQYVDAYDFKFGVDAIPTQRAILASNGTSATTLNWDSVDSSLLSQVQGQNSSQLVTGPDPCVSYSNLDTRKVPLEVRKAYAVAYPFDQIRKAAGENSLTYAPATSYMGPQVPGFTKYAPVNGLTGQGQGDPAKAKQMLQAAGKLGFEISYYYANNNPIAVQSNAAKKAGLQAAGFKVKDVGVPKTDLRKRIAETDGKVNSGQGPRGWCYDWPQGDSVYPALFTTAVQKSGQSVGFLADKGLDAEINAALALPAEQQGAKWSAIDKEIAEKFLPAVPTDYGKANFLFGKQVHNVQNDPNRGMPDLAQIWVG
ncbi:ABC transporter substrate-binding protein [Calidifontibacter sp. DB0510]|uniref:ABC transporter substrate-binding protein n=1 Tax=Metallococcus carri TaxID=1656884 RepID=A0A967E9B7_9MICO|nr:ABC transporter substrate-binding protein [Metallococcus carri]NHN55035.1 ABC transporter substrate-binding protein [Metallococcus carri]NOP37381.1 ABC transporter substrate-binding protein [Calidifontibacter sp. DB2511S]